MKIIKHFELGNNFRFHLTLESASVESHSLLSSSSNKEFLSKCLSETADELSLPLKHMIEQWKEKHK